MSGETRSEQGIREIVRQGYARVATGGTSCCGGGNAEQLAGSIGYSENDLAGLPAGANLGLSCGNPTALAALRAGEVVVDLGCGAGFDVYQAGPRVGSAGRVIGVDMTAEMLDKARAGLADYRRRSGLDNVEFRLGEIEHLPLADASADVVLSNCVINLSPDKAQVWREISRVLRPGGRVAVSDLALLRPLPEAIVEMIAALVGCVAGAVTVAQTERDAKQTGLTDVRIEPKAGYVEAMSEWKDPLWHKIVAALPPGSSPADYVASVDITARKPV